MRSSDFRAFGLRHVTERNIKDSGASLESVDIHLVITLDRMYDYLKRDHQAVRVIIAPDGLTSGVHSSPWHARGLAVDLLFDCELKHVDIYDQIKIAIESGFRGVGCYWTGAGYRLHCDARARLALWGGRLDGTDQWTYRSVFNDPRKWSIPDSGDKQALCPVSPTTPVA